MMRLAPKTRQDGRALPRLLGLVLIACGLAVLMLGGYLIWNSLQARMALESAADAAREQVEQIEQRIASIRSAIQSDEFTSTATRTEPVVDRSTLIAALRARGVRNVLNIVVANQAIEEVDLSAFPGRGFAALEMLFKARTDGSVPAQVHFIGTPDEYLAIAERLDAEQASGPVALVTFPVSVLVNQVTLPETVQAMRLVQEVGGSPETLEEFGRRFGPANELLSIDGSLFQLAWHRSSVIGPMSTLQLAGVTGIGILMAVLGLLITRRSRPVAISAEHPPARESEAEAAVAVAEDRPAEDATLPRTTETARSAQDNRPERIRRTEVLDPESLEPLDDDKPSLQAGRAGGLEDAQAADPDPITIDGETRREPAEQRSFEAPELNAQAASRQAGGDGRDDHPQAGEDGEFLFEPDSTADDQAEISAMLRSLVEEEDAGQEDAATPLEPDAAVESPAEESAATFAPEPVVPPASIFRAYDIRGVVGETLSAEIAEAIGRAIGSEARSRSLSRVAVARDGRLSGAELLAALSRGLVASGVDVIDVGAVPTPVLYYAAQELAGGSGVMVTGSHNPPDYNGFKIVLGGETLSGERITALHTRLAEGRLESGQGQISQQRITVQYIERIGTDIQLEKPLKVVADCGNGIAGAIAPRLLEAIGAEVIPLYAEVDGTFPNHHPDPGDPATLEDLRLCVRNFNADVGVAFDGDGDRLGVVAPDGEIIYPDRLMMLFARDVLSRNPGEPIIFDVKCSGLLAGVIEDAGGKPIMARTGHSFIKEQLKREQAPLAGEMSGHFFFGERWYGFDDGMYAAARLLEILAADTRAPAQILASLPKAESTPELKVEMKEGEPHPFVEEFASSIDFEGAEINDIDGVRADFEDGFGLVRASNTTPVLVVRFEGRDKQALARIQELFRKAMLEVNPALKLPF